MATLSGAAIVLSTPHSRLAIAAPSPNVILVEASGVDTGEHGQLPFATLNALLRNHQATELFFDARAARTPTIEVTTQWARWLSEHRKEVRYVTVLTKSHAMKVTADVVRRLAGLGTRLQVLTDPRAFESALRVASQAVRAREKDRLWQ